MRKCRTLIVDDEYAARQELRYLLSQFTDIEVVGEATTSREALTLISSIDYHLLFLDIMMPGMSGLELSATIRCLPCNPHIIFVSAYEDYAAEAFDVDAVDYLLKPVEEESLRRVLQKVRQRVGIKDVTAQVHVQAPAIIDRIPAQTTVGKTVLVPTQDIVFLYTEQSRIYIQTHNKKFVTRLTLDELESRLKTLGFFRAHRCYIVNLKNIKEIVPFDKETYNLVLNDVQCSAVPLSRQRAKVLRKSLGLSRFR